MSMKKFNFISTSKSTKTCPLAAAKEARYAATRPSDSTAMLKERTQTCTTHGQGPGAASGVAVTHDLLCIAA